MPLPSNDINDLLSAAFTTDSDGRVALRFVSAGFAADSVKVTHIDWGTGAGQVSAGDIPIADTGNHFTATDIEAALAELASGGVSGAPTDATYLVQVPNGSLSNEQALSTLATGIVKNTTSTGVLSIAVAGTDYYAPGGTDIPVTDGGTGASTASNARTNLGLSIGADVQAYDATLAALASYNTNGIITQTAADTFTGRTITGTTNVIDVTNGNGVAGNPTLTISAAYIGQSSITTVGTITTGIWNGTEVAVLYGGTGSTTASGARTNLGAASSALTITAGDGLTGGGDLSANRSFALSITGLTAETTVDGGADYIVMYDASASAHRKVLISNLPTAGGGETNTASNGGTGGVGVYDSKSGVNLIFRNIIADSSKVVVALDGANKEVGIDIVEANIDHNSLLNYDAAKHFTQASITTVGTIATGVWNGTDIAVADGGTGSSTAAGARTNLGLAIGTDVQAYDDDLAAIAAMSTTGILTRTASGTFAARTITGVTNRTTVTNGDGVSGQPTIDISSSYVGQATITTLGTIATGVWNGTTIAVANGGSGATTLTGILKGNGTSAFTAVTAPSGTLVGTSDTQTLTNKRVDPRVTSETSSATPTINTDNSDAHSITALAAAVTSMTTNLSGTPVNFQKLIVRFKDNGTARAITWGSSFEAKGVALPTTTVISKVLTVGFIYDTVSAKWGCVASAQEA